MSDSESPSIGAETAEPPPRVADENEPRPAQPEHGKGVSVDFVALGLVVAACLLVRCLVLSQPLAVIDSIMIPDDTYLALAIARNIANGLGPLHGVGYTNGFQPLYVFLMVPVFRLVPAEPFLAVKAALLLLILFDTATIVLLWKLLRSYSDNIFPRLTVCAIWALSAPIVETALNGLETAIACFFIVAILLYAERFRGKEPPTPRGAFLLGVLCGLAVLARLDSLIFLAAFGLFFASRVYRSASSVRSAVATLATVAAGAIVVYAPWMVYSYVYTGSIYPISGRAVRFWSLAHVNHQPTYENFYKPLVALTYDALLYDNLWIAVALLAAAAAFVVVLALRGGRTLDRQQARLWLGRVGLLGVFTALLLAAYTCYIFTPWFFPRYFHPISLLFLILVAAFVDLAVRACRSHREGVVLGVVLLACAVGASAADPKFSRLFAGSESEKGGYMAVGLWARQRFPDGTRIGAAQVGAMGYFADNLVVINLDGVVNADAYNALVERRALDYVENQRIRYIVDSTQALNILVKYSDESAFGDLERLGTVPGLRSWSQSWVLFEVVSRR